MPPAPAPLVLVVEDEPNIRELVALHLRLEHAEPVEVADGNAALDLARERRFDLVILDLMLPGLDGVTVCRAIRRESANVATPILMPRSVMPTLFLLAAFWIAASYLRASFLLADPTERQRMLWVVNGFSAAAWVVILGFTVVLAGAFDDDIRSSHAWVPEGPTNRGDGNSAEASPGF